MSDLDIEFVFLFSPNNSGTTVISQYLAQQTGGYLPPFGNNEGQMAPAVREMMRDRPWAEDRKFDWPFIRSEWEKLCRSSGKSLFIEASPPNLMRADEIINEFGDSASYVASISSPYMQIASSAFNYSKPPLQSKFLINITNQWISKANKLRFAIKKHPEINFFSYHDFCKDYTIANKKLGIAEYDVNDIEGKKNTNENKIMDMSSKNIAFLASKEISEINRTLEGSEEVLEFFGLHILTPKELFKRAYLEPHLVHSGLIRRIKWESQLNR